MLLSLYWTPVSGLGFSEKKVINFMWLQQEVFIPRARNEEPVALRLNASIKMVDAQEDISSSSLSPRTNIRLSMVY